MWTMCWMVRDATLVCPKREAQRVKELVGKVKEKFGDAFQ